MTISTVLQLRPVRFQNAARVKVESRFKIQPRIAADVRTCLVRRFIATGDPRCPLACVWSLLQETGAPAAISMTTTDEPELRWSAAGALLPRRTLTPRPLHDTLILAC